MAFAMPQAPLALSFATTLRLDGDRRHFAWPNGDGLRFGSLFRAVKPSGLELVRVGSRLDRRRDKLSDAAGLAHQVAVNPDLGIGLNEDPDSRGVGFHCDRFRLLGGRRGLLR